MILDIDARRRALMSKLRRQGFPVYDDGPFAEAVDQLVSDALQAEQKEHELDIAARHAVLQAEEIARLQQELRNEEDEARLLALRAQRTEEEVARLRAALDKARRETASDPGNRWCRNATIILNEALRAGEK